MFISKLSIKNFRLFDENKEYEIEDFNVLNNQNEGSGLTVFVEYNVYSFSLPLLITLVIASLPKL